jgi:hypothetical protein
MMMRRPSCRISISVPIPHAARKAAGISTPREFPTLRIVVCIFLPPHMLQQSHNIAWRKATIFFDDGVQETSYLTIAGNYFPK